MAPAAVTKRDVTPFQRRYLRGGCADYADALLATVGGTPYAVLVNDEIHHFVVKLGDTYADVLGQHTKQEVLDAWGIALNGRASLRRARKSDFVGFETDEAHYADAVSDVEGRAWTEVG